MNFIFVKEFWKKKRMAVSTKLSISTTVFNIDSNKMFLELHISILDWFQKDFI